MMFNEYSLYTTQDVGMIPENFLDIFVQLRDSSFWLQSFCGLVHIYRNIYIYVYIYIIFIFIFFTSFNYFLAILLIMGIANN